MNLKDILDEVKERGEKLKDEIVSEIVHSKTLAQIVSNKNFISAISRVIETKDEVKKVIQNQVHNLFQMMDVPSKSEFSRIGKKLSDLENSIEKIGIETLASRPKATNAKKTAAAKTSGTRKSSGKKSARKKT